MKSEEAKNKKTRSNSSLEAAKIIGVWMDNSSAHIMEYTAEPIRAIIIRAKPAQEGGDHHTSRNENVGNNKEQHQKAGYYKNLMEVIRTYEDVLLFGPTTAKNELANLMKDDHRCENIKVAVKGADTMSSHQMHAFIREHFSTP